MYSLLSAVLIYEKISGNSARGRKNVRLVVRLNSIDNDPYLNQSSDSPQGGRLAARLVFLCVGEI